ncbi:unnamed protein product, partial [Iphiclides podalirius]
MNEVLSNQLSSESARRSAARHTLGRADSAALRQRGARVGGPRRVAGRTRLRKGGGGEELRPALLHPPSASSPGFDEKRDISRATRPT